MRQIIIEVDGGIVQAVYTNDPQLEVTVADRDTEAIIEDELVLSTPAILSLDKLPLDISERMEEIA